jgi:hypothetical protein
MARQEPIGKHHSMPMQGKVSITETIAYKKEKYLIFKTNIVDSHFISSRLIAFFQITPE